MGRSEHLTYNVTSQILSRPGRIHGQIYCVFSLIFKTFILFFFFTKKTSIFVQRLSDNLIVTIFILFSRRVKTRLASCTRHCRITFCRSLRHRRTCGAETPRRDRCVLRSLRSTGSLFSLLFSYVFYGLRLPFRCPRGCPIVIYYCLAAIIIIIIIS